MKHFRYVKPGDEVLYNWTHKAIVVDKLSTDELEEAANFCDKYDDSGVAIDQLMDDCLDSGWLIAIKFDDHPDTAVTQYGEDCHVETKPRESENYHKNHISWCQKQEDMFENKVEDLQIQLAHAERQLRESGKTTTDAMVEAHHDYPEYFLNPEVK